MDLPSQHEVIAHGHSMWPLIPQGSVVTVAPADPASLVAGEIVVFERGGQVVLHRIIRCEKDRIREKGDNARTGSWIDRSAVRGKAVRAIRGARRIELDGSVPASRQGLFLRMARVEDAVFSRLASWPPLLRRPAEVLSRSLLLPGCILARPALGTYPFTEAGSSAAEAEGMVKAFRRLLGRGDGTTVPWEGLGDLLAHHRLEGLASEMDPRFAPARQRAAMVHMAAEATLVDAARALSGRSIPFAVLKGPPLAMALYGEVGLRPFSDVDILVAPGQRDEALAALSDAGYREQGTWLQRSMVRRFHFHAVLTPAGKMRVGLELHWALVDRANFYRIDEAAVRSRIRAGNLHGVGIGLLSAEDELIHLLLHVAKHGLFNRAALAAGSPTTWLAGSSNGNRLLWFADIQLFLQRHGASLDASALKDRALQWNVMPDVVATLAWLDRLMPEGEARRLLEHVQPGWTPVPLRGAEEWVQPGWVGRGMRPAGGLTLRPARLSQLGMLLFPCAGELRRFYEGSILPTGLLALLHPMVMIRRLLVTPRAGSGSGRGSL